MLGFDTGRLMTNAAIKVGAKAGLIAGLMVTGACSTAGSGPEVAATASATAITSVAPVAVDKEADRKAILAMAGDYKVTFDFTETVSHQPGYKLKPKKLSGAFETVIVIADEPDFISLQHILVVGDAQEGMAIKHWRQDWRYEPETMLTFVGGNAWENKDVLAAERHGAWSQTVYQVDDSPRYSGLARWDHSTGSAIWDAAPSWRPLPRRDMTTRDDYHAISAANRHALTPDGWVHEQDNAKLILSGETPVLLAREVGINTYRKSTAYNSKIATDYWAQTKAYWAGVRGLWDELEAGGYMAMTMARETEPVYTPLMGLAIDVSAGDKTAAEAIAEARAVIRDFTEVKAIPLADRLKRVEPSKSGR